MSSKSARKHGWSRSSPGWKDVQFAARSKKRTRLAFYIIVFVSVLLIISWVFRFAQSLFYPLRSNAGQHRVFTWNGEFNINLLIRTNNISLFVYNPKEQKIFIVN